jgi:hypothetical protein
VRSEEEGRPPALGEAFSAPPPGSGGGWGVVDLNPGVLQVQGLLARETKKIVPYATRATMKQLMNFSFMTFLLTRVFRLLLCLRATAIPGGRIL